MLMRTPCIATLLHYLGIRLRNGSKGDCFNQPSELFNEVRSAVPIQPPAAHLTGLFLIGAFKKSVYLSLDSDVYRFMAH